MNWKIFIENNFKRISFTSKREYDTFIKTVESIMSKTISDLNLCQKNKADLIFTHFIHSIQPIDDTIKSRIDIDQLFGQRMFYILFIDACIEYLTNVNSDKFATASRINKLTHKLSQTLPSSLNFKSNIFDHYDYISQNPIERKLNLLKLMHEGIDVQMASEKTYTSLDTVAQDLRELEIDDFHFLGQRIKVNTETIAPNKKLYTSTVHPIFLPLNLYEVFNLTAILKKLSHNTPYEHALHHLADKIFNQLSDYGQTKIIQTLSASGESNIHFNTNSSNINRFEEEDVYYTADISNKIGYAYKSSSKINLSYTYKEIVKHLAGCNVLGIDHRDNTFMIQFQNKSITVPFSSVVDCFLIVRE